LGIPPAIRSQPDRGWALKAITAREETVAAAMRELAVACSGHHLRHGIAGTPGDPTPLRRAHGLDQYPWYTISTERFSADFGVDESFGLNIFRRDANDVYRTYFLQHGSMVQTIGSAVAGQFYPSTLSLSRNSS
jgi:hypothetical protein